MKALIVIFAATAALSAQNPAQEAALGRQWMREWKVAETPPAIAALVKSLAPEAAVDIQVVESEEKLANSYPGRMVYVSTALLESATQAELAAILAHQIAHAVGYRSERVPNLPLVFLGTSSGLCEKTVRNRLLLPLGFKERIASREAEADSLAAHYLEAAGYAAIDWKPIFESTPPVRPASDEPPRLRRSR